VARGLLRKRPRSTIPGTAEYEWKHALIRDVAYGALPRAERARRHAQIAAWLRSTSRAGGEPIASIAYHYECAWELAASKTGPGPDPLVAGQAADYLTRWAEQVFVWQARAAEPLFRRALRVTEATGRAADPRIVARASLGLAEALIEMGSHPEAIDQATRARRLAERGGDADLAARALLALGRSVSDGGQLRRGRTLLEDARKRFEIAGDLRGQGWALHRLSETWGWAGLERELDDLRSAYRLFARARDRFGRAVVANDLAYILSVEGGAEFNRWYEQARRLVEGEGDLRSRASLLRTWAHYCYSAGRFTEAIGAAEVCRPVAAESGDRYTESDALLIGALANAHVGHPATALSLAREAAAMGNDLGSVRIPALGRLAIARAEVRAGRPAMGARALRQAREAVRSHGVRVMHGDLAEAEAMLMLDQGRWDRADAAAQALQAALRAVPMGLWAPLPALIRGRGLLGAARPGEAVAAFDEAIAAATEAEAAGALALAKAYRPQASLLAGGRAGRIASHRTAVAEAEVASVTAETAGIAALLRDDAQTAADSLDAAVEGWAQFGATSWLARALSLRAIALRAAGDRARAASSMGRARATMDEVRMPARDRATIERPLGDRT
jgi:tetratricopeptide (TPR) repeat protein